jgi:hypothetical protein
MAILEKTFKATSLSQLLNQSGKPHPLCDFVNPGKITLGIKS